MSTIYNQVVTTFRAVGGNVVSQLSAYSAGFGRLGQTIDQNAQMSSRLNNQWRAIGTTMRYAIAGTAVFGLTRLVGQLSSVNQQLGEMQALSEIGPGTRFTDTGINALLGNLSQTAVDTVTPLSQVNDAAVNFLSTVQGVKPGELPRMLTDIGRAAKIAQTPIEDLTQAATVAQVQFRRPVSPQTIGQFTRMWQFLIGEAPGASTAGPSIAQAMPGLASMFQAFGGGGVSPRQQQAQLMGLTLGVLRTGMPPATGMRGLQFLLQSLAQPTGGAKTALAGIGITPEFIRDNGIAAAVMRMARQVTPVGTATQKQLAGLPEESNALPGIDPVQAAKLRQFIPRIHGIRALIILASQLQSHGNVESIQQDMENMLQVQNAQSRQAHDVAKAWRDFEKRSKLAQAAVAINAMGIQVAEMFNPVLNFVARGPLHLFHAMNQHHGAATIAGRTFVGALAGVGLARFFGAGRMFPQGSILNRALTGGMSAVPKTMATMAALTGNPAILGATPENPVYVSVINDLFGGATPVPTPHGGGGGAFGFLKRAAGWTGVAALARYGGAIPSLLGRAGSAIEGAGAEIPGVADWRMWWPGAMNPQTHRRNPGWENLVSLGLVNPENVHHLQQIHHARQVLGGNIVDVQGINKAMWHGQVDMNMVITREHADGSKTRQRVHVPVDLWAKGRHPSHRGQAGKTVRTK